MDVDAFFTKIADDRIKRKLFETTDELIGRGGFGTPTFFIDGDDMYFGNDRFELMQAALDRK
jgi:2-hydroxychromene-2-carboxylate isomerase